jgi:hypothetical protein
MSAIPPSQRIELSPAVRTILDADGPKSEFLQHFVRYLQALLDPNTAGLDKAVAEWRKAGRPGRACAGEFCDLIERLP